MVPSGFGCVGFADACCGTLCFRHLLLNMPWRGQRCVQVKKELDAAHIDNTAKTILAKVNGSATPEFLRPPSTPQLACRIRTSYLHPRGAWNCVTRWSDTLVHNHFRLGRCLFKRPTSTVPSLS